MADALFEKLREITTEAAWGALTQRGYEHCFIGNLTVVHPELTMVGRARTLRFVPYRPDLEEDLLARNSQPLHKVVVEDAEPGEVLVVDGCGRNDAGVMGDMILSRFVQRGGAGVVVDGAIRDLAYMRGIDLPIYIGAAHSSAITGKLLALEQQVPIQVAGVCVRPGDFLLGDAQGVVVLPPKIADEIIAEASSTEAKEAFLRRKMDQGATLYEAYPPNAEIEAEYERFKEE